jgi:hypothetical protein
VDLAQLSQEKSTSHNNSLLDFNYFCRFGPRPPKYDYASTRFSLLFLAISIITCTVMGSSRERAVQKKINGRIAEAEKLDQDFDAVLSEIYGATGLPIRTADQLELETREMKDRLAKILADFRSHTSFLRLETLVNVFGALALLGYSVCAIAAYTNWIFPFIPLKLGGGEIIAVMLYQMDQNQPWQSIHGGMLDESDQGFYVLPSGHDKGLFIPKERIGAIYFGDGRSELGDATK